MKLLKEQKKSNFLNHLNIKDLKAFHDFYDNIEKNQEAQDTVGMYVKEFGISNCSFKILTQNI